MPSISSGFVQGCVVGSHDRLTWGANSPDRSNNSSFATCECTHLSDFSIIDNPVAVFSGLKDRYSDAWKEERAKRDHWVIVSATLHRSSGNKPLLTRSELICCHYVGIAGSAMRPVVPVRHGLCPPLHQRPRRAVGIRIPRARDTVSSSHIAPHRLDHGQVQELIW